jgi:hypothetical protein
MLTRNHINRRQYGHPQGPDAPPTVAELFEGYEADAAAYELDLLTGDGLEAPVIAWMQADPEREQALAEHVDALVHKTLLRRGEHRTEAVDEFVAGMRPWVARFVEDYPEDRMNAWLEREADRLRDLAESYGEDH